MQREKQERRKDVNIDARCRKDPATRRAAFFVVLLGPRSGMQERSVGVVWRSGEAD